MYRQEERPPGGGRSNGASPPVSRILSWTAIYLGPTLLPASCGLPGTWRAGHPVPARPCSGWGLPSRPGSPGRWWSLTPPFHPHLYPGMWDSQGPSAVCSLLHCPSGCPAWVLPSILPCGVRTFLDPKAAAVWRTRSTNA